jgi:hypothetical protein
MKNSKNKVDLLKKLVQEVLQEKKVIKLYEMPRIATGVKLAPDWEEKWNKSDETVRLSRPLNRVVTYLKANGTGTLKSIANDAFNSPFAMQPAAGPVSLLKKLGIVIDDGLVSAPKEKTTKTGEFGRPKIVDEEIKALGMGLINKFSKGLKTFTEEEIMLIQNLYDAANSSTETEIETEA